MGGRNVSAQSNRLSQTSPNMPRLNVKAGQGSPTKEIGFYAERASIHSIPKPKVKDKPSLAIFKPSLFLINPKLAQTRAFDSMTDELPSWMSREMVSGTLSRLFLIVSKTWGFLWRKAAAVVMSITWW